LGLRNNDSHSLAVVSHAVAFYKIYMIDLDCHK